MTDIPLKTCISCHATKPLTEYHKDKNVKCGYRSTCKLCIKSQNTKQNPIYAEGTQAKILRVIRIYGQPFEQINERLNVSIGTSLTVLQTKEMIVRDADGIYTITEKGQAACPPRNPHYAKRILKKQDAIQCD